MKNRSYHVGMKRKKRSKAAKGHKTQKYHDNLALDKAVKKKLTLQKEDDIKNEKVLEAVAEDVIDEKEKV